MLDPSALLKASLDVGRDLFRASPGTTGARSGSVPIRSLGPSHRERIAQHLLALDERDRYLRFGYPANDAQVRRYADGLNFDRDDIFGIYNRKLELLAMAHLAFSVDPQFNTCAEFGVSVAQKARGRGYGGRLFDRAVIHARNEGVTQIFIHALSENTTMLKIARKAGAVIERDGSESEAHLRLPEADFESRVSELVDEQLARTDYHLKAQARQFWSMLGTLQDIRQGVRDAREKASP
ncbi:GNAT family N-acetyltransferase [Hydrogenophaga sp. OTU3427]|uniref:GNAT family N-acetyltransferase n=1 Tax=Hydrogenophaga sp. OTU3427 TaxID=3043856 RepID=UPI00313F367C